MSEEHAVTETKNAVQLSTFVHAERIHITDDGEWTGCGWPVTQVAGADDVLSFGVCGKCRRDGER